MSSSGGADRRKGRSIAVLFMQWPFKKITTIYKFSLPEMKKQNPIYSDRQKKCKKSEKMLAIFFFFEVGLNL